MFTKAQVHAMLDDIRDANSSITCGSVIQRIRDDIDKDPPSVPPDPQTTQPVDTLAQRLMILVCRIQDSDQGDYYEVDRRGWEALCEVVMANMDSQTARIIRTAAKVQLESPPINECPTCGEGEYMGRYCIDCGRDTRSS